MDLKLKNQPKILRSIAISSPLLKPIPLRIHKPQTYPFSRPLKTLRFSSKDSDFRRFMVRKGQFSKKPVSSSLSKGLFPRLLGFLSKLKDIKGDKKSDRKPKKNLKKKRDPNHSLNGREILKANVKSQRNHRLTESSANSQETLCSLSLVPNLSTPLKFLPNPIKNLKRGFFVLEEGNNSESEEERKLRIGKYESKLKELKREVISKQVAFNFEIIEGSPMKAPLERRTTKNMVDLLESIFEKCEIDPEKIGGLIDEFRKRNVDLPFSELGELLQRFKRKQEQEKQPGGERRVIDVVESAKSQIEKAQKGEERSLPKRYFRNLVEERKEEQTVNMQERLNLGQLETSKSETNEKKEVNLEKKEVNLEKKEVQSKKKEVNLEKNSPNIEKKQGNEESLNLKKKQELSLQPVPFESPPKDEEKKESKPPSKQPISKSSPLNSPKIHPSINAFPDILQSKDKDKPHFTPSPPQISTIDEKLPHFTPQMSAESTSYPPSRPISKAKNDHNPPSEMYQSEVISRPLETVVVQQEKPQNVEIAHFQTFPTKDDHSPLSQFLQQNVSNPFVQQAQTFVGPGNQSFSLDSLITPNNQHQNIFDMFRRKEPEPPQNTFNPNRNPIDSMINQPAFNPPSNLFPQNIPPAHNLNFPPQQQNPIFPFQNQPPMMPSSNLFTMNPRPPNNSFIEANMAGNQIFPQGPHLFPQNNPSPNYFNVPPNNNSNNIFTGPNAGMMLETTAAGHSSNENPNNVSFSQNIFENNLTTTNNNTRNPINLFNSAVETNGHAAVSLFTQRTTPINTQPTIPQSNPPMVSLFGQGPNMSSSQGNESLLDRKPGPLRDETQDRMLRKNEMQKKGVARVNDR